MSLQNLQADLIDSMFTEDTFTLSSVKPASRLRIYRNNIYSGMIMALCETYPLIKQLLGENFFILAAKDYIDRYPSRSPDLYEYGEYFYYFIAEFEYAKEFTYLGEVAKFEWACHEIIAAGAHAILDLSILKNVNIDDYGKLHFYFHPACRLMHFRFPILDIIDLCKHIRKETVDLDKGGVNLILFRSENEIKMVQLDDAEYIFLYTLQSNMPFSVAVDEAMTMDTKFDVQKSLYKWVENKILVDASVIE
jgi:hypothetical protein